MIYIEIMGGLGNQLFQIFCGIAYSLENRIPFKINVSKFDLVSPLDNISKRPTYWENFLSNLSNFTYRDQLQIRYSHNETSHFKFTKIPYINHDFKLRGYYQSYKYFDGQYANICKMINLDSQKAGIAEKHKDLLGGTKKPISISGTESNRNPNSTTPKGGPAVLINFPLTPSKTLMAAYELPLFSFTFLVSKNA
jgi:hypothetical protein